MRLKSVRRLLALFTVLLACVARPEAMSAGIDEVSAADTVCAVSSIAESADLAVVAVADSVPVPVLTADSIFSPQFKSLYGAPTLYDFTYSRTLSMPDWKRLWINTGVLMGAGVATMVILESLPADATAWNKKANEEVPMFRRWVNHVKAGPVWDRDNKVFNYVLHPYAGAAYYMGARSCGFNCWGSFLYSFCISTFFWEYGFEAFNEIPSVQDLVVTPVLGSLLGEGFYLIKRKIVSNGYRLWGSKFAGYAVAFLVDPLNEAIGYFRGDQRKSTRRNNALKGLSGSSWLSPGPDGLQGGISLVYNF